MGCRGSVSRLALGWQRVGPLHGGELPVRLPQFLCDLSGENKQQTSSEHVNGVYVGDGGWGSKVKLFYRLVELDLLLQVLLHDPVVVVDTVAVEVVHLSCGR